MNQLCRMAHIDLEIYECKKRVLVITAKLSLVWFTSYRLGRGIVT